jgi:hypothetical protein
MDPNGAIASTEESSLPRPSMPGLPDFIGRLSRALNLWHPDYQTFALSARRSPK